MPKIAAALFIFVLVTLASCDNDSELPINTCGDTFLYGSGEDSYTLTSVPGSVFIELQDPENPEAQIEALFDEYDFLDDTNFPQGNNLTRFFALLKDESCKSLIEALKILNKDEKI